MWLEQIVEYIHLTYNRNLDKMMDQGVDKMDPHTVFRIKGDVIWKIYKSTRTTETIQENVYTCEKRIS